MGYTSACIISVTNVDDCLLTSVMGRFVRWYRIMSPKIELEVNSVCTSKCSHKPSLLLFLRGPGTNVSRDDLLRFKAYDKEKGKVFLDIVQKFHIRWNPLPPSPARYVLSEHILFT